MDITYKRNLNFIGRNGLFKQGGLVIRPYPFKKAVSLSPLTSKGQDGNALMEVPIENVPQVIAALQEIMRENVT